MVFRTPYCMTSKIAGLKATKILGLSHRPKESLLSFAINSPVQRPLVQSHPESLESVPLSEALVFLIDPGCSYYDINKKSS